MGFWFCLLLFFLANPLHAQFARRNAVPITTDSQNELKQFTSLKNKKGNLLNPPWGAVRQDIQESVTFIQEMIDDLKGKQLRLKNKNLVIHIYDKVVPNAWIQQFSKQSHFDQEQEWQKKHVNETWPLRKTWGFDNNEPIYELGITTGLLSIIESRSELAFILGHELTHLLEGHTDRGKTDDEIFEAWWNRQVHEVVADGQSIESILGKYDLDGAIRIMTKLFPKQKISGSDDEITESVYVRAAKNALSAGAGTHHAEGVRFSLLLFLIENYKHTKENAHISIDETLPNCITQIKSKTRFFDFFKPEPQNLSQFHAILNKIIQKQDIGTTITKPETLGLSDSSNDPLIEVIRKLSPRELILWLTEALPVISKSPITKSEKINIFLQLIALVGSRTTSYLTTNLPYLAELTAKEASHIKKFLLENAVGKEHWTASSFFAEKYFDHPQALNHLQYAFFGSVAGQKLMGDLIKLSPAWNDFVKELGKIDHYIQNGKTDFLAIGKFLSLIDPKDKNRGKMPNDLRLHLRRHFFNSLNNFEDKAFLVRSPDPTRVTQFSLFYNKANRSPNKLDASFEAEFQSVLRHYDSIYWSDLINSTESLLNQMTGKNYRETEVFNHLDYFNNTHLSEQNFTRLLIAFQNMLNNMVKPQICESYYDSYSLVDSILYFAVHLIERAGDKKALTRDILEKMAVLFETHSWLDSSNISSETLNKWKKYINLLDKNDFMFLLFNRTPAEREADAFMQDLIRKYPGVDKAAINTKLNKLIKAKKITADTSIGLRKKWRAQEYNLIVQSNRGRFALALMQLLGRDNPAWQSTQFNLQDLENIFTQLELLGRWMNFKNSPESIEQPTDVAMFLYQIFAENLSSMNQIEKFYQNYNRIRKLTGDQFIGEPNLENQIRKHAEKLLSFLSLQKQKLWLAKKIMQKIVGPEFLAETLKNYVLEQIQLYKKDPIQVITQVLKDFPMEMELPEAYAIFRNRVSEGLNLQPFQSTSYFPQDPRSVTEKLAFQNDFIRALSAVSTYIRAIPFAEQLEMIEFLMGRQIEIPRAIEASEKDIRHKEFQNVRYLFLKIREEMKYRTALDRAMLLNTLLTGPNSLLECSDGFDLVLRHILKMIPPENKEFSRSILEALVRAESHSKSLLFSYILAQKSDAEGKPLNESLILKSFIDAYGAPGIKLAQYLAFTEEFSSFREILEKYQDEALPLGYFEVIRLLEEQIGSAWDPLRFRVVRILGSGSVNITIEYEDLLTHKREAISVLRSDIEAKTKEDFLRMQNLTRELSKDTKRGQDFAFVNGLLKIIEKSVSLEFDKTNALQIQNSIQSIYRRSHNGWNFQSVPAIELLGKGLRMDKAPGVTARKFRKIYPEIYDEIMKGFLQIEFEVLMGVNETRNYQPLPLHANPDVHDGQFLIDLESHTVTLIDFGQAIGISNIERDFAADLLRIIKGVEFAGASVRILEEYAHLLDVHETANSIILDSEKLKSILKRSDEMDKFVRLLAYLHDAGFEVPLATVHWILAANRLSKLALKIKDPGVRRDFTMLVASRKLGLSQSQFNRAYQWLDDFSHYLGLSSSVNKPTIKIKMRCEEIILE